MRIILDAAHGIEVPGKRSPDGSFREYKWSREFISLLSGKLEAKGIDYALTVKDEYEPGLKERVRRTNKLSAEVNDNAIFLSFHSNAAGMGDKWMKARGFSIWTSRGRTKADDYGEVFYSGIDREFSEIPLRSDYSDGDADYESNFAVLMCRIPAILFEILFQDNREDVEFLKSEEFNERLADCITRTIEKIINTCQNQNIQN